MKHELNNGDYVLATKYANGDPHDAFCVGFLEGLTGISPHITLRDMMLWTEMGIYLEETVSGGLKK